MISRKDAKRSFQDTHSANKTQSNFLCVSASLRFCVKLLTFNSNHQ